MLTLHFRKDTVAWERSLKRFVTIFIELKYSWSVIVELLRVKLQRQLHVLEIMKYLDKRESPFNYEVDYQISQTWAAQSKRGDVREPFFLK